MKRPAKIAILIGAALLVALMIALQGMPGSVLAAKDANGGSAHKEYVVALVGLLLLGFMALGLDVRDWL